MNIIKIGLAAALLLFLSGCKTTIVTSTVTADFRTKQGAYVVGYTENKAGRVMIEDRLVADLIERDMVAWASHLTLENIIGATPQEIKNKASEKKALSVIVLNRVASDASDSIVKNPDRISPIHPTLKAFHAHSLEAHGKTYDPEQEVFVEVNLFILDGDEAKLFWSGTTWTFDATDQTAAVNDISKTIADQLALVRDRYR